MIKVIFALFLIGCSPAFAADYHVLDGDTVKIGNIKHRFWGVDAFEKDQTCHDVAGVEYSCGLKAKEYLGSLMRGKIIICEVTGTDMYNRSISTCTANGKDLSLLMVLEGWAFDYPIYSKGAYRQAQSIAQLRLKGAHAGHFQNPREYRKLKKEF